MFALGLIYTLLRTMQTVRGSVPLIRQSLVFYLAGLASMNTCYYVFKALEYMLPDVPLWSPG